MCHQTKPNFLAFLVGEAVWMTILTKVSSLMGCGCDSILKGVHRISNQIHKNVSLYSFVDKLVSMFI